MLVEVHARHAGNHCRGVEHWRHIRDGARVSLIQLARENRCRRERNSGVERWIGASCKIGEAAPERKIVRVVWRLAWSCAAEWSANQLRRRNGEHECLSRVESD